MRSTPFVAGATVVLAATGIGILTPTPANAWQPPTVTATGGTCPGGTDAPPRLILWTVVNRETGFLRSPATISALSVTPDLPTSWVTAPGPIPNGGTNFARLQTYVPPTYAGKVKLHVEVSWAGLDGSHPPIPVDKSVTVVACPHAPPPPPVVTTSTTTKATTSTVASTTSTLPPTTVAVSPVALPAPAAVAVTAAPAYTG